MTDEKIFLKEIISASIAGDDKKCASLMAKRTSEHINRIHIEKISSIEAPCLVAAIMKIYELYLNGFDAKTIELAKEIAKHIDIAGVRYELNKKVGDIDV